MTTQNKNEIGYPLKNSKDFIGLGNEVLKFADNGDVPLANGLDERAIEVGRKLSEDLRADEIANKFKNPEYIPTVEQLNWANAPAHNPNKTDPWEPPTK